MAYFGTALERALERSEFGSGADLARRIEVNTGSISRYLKKGLLPRPEILADLVKALPQEHSDELVEAYLWDHLAPELHQIVLRTRAGTVSETPNRPYGTRLPADLEKIFLKMRKECGADQGFADYIRHFARIVGFDGEG